MFKKFFLLSVVLAVVFVFIISSLSFAGGRYNDCYSCDCYKEKGVKGQYYNNELKKFKEETFGLRQKASEKRFEIEKEYLSDKPDETKISKLQEELKQLRENILEIRKKHNLVDKRSGRNCY